MFGWQGGVLDPKGPIATAERLILFNATAIMLAVVIPVIVLTLAFAWWFRAGNEKATYLPNWSYSGRIELVVWSIPALVVMFLSGIAWIGSQALDPPRSIPSNSKPIEIEVVSLDWKWLFLYPGHGIASINRLVVPAAVPISFRLTSASVMNSFFVPQLGSQIYTMSGMTTRLNLMADQPGSFAGFSAQFSGLGFSDMRFVVEALPQEGFEAFLDAAHKGGGTLDKAGLAQLRHPTVAVQPLTYGTVADGLFDELVAGAAGHAMRQSPLDGLQAAAVCTAGEARSGGDEAVATLLRRPGRSGAGP